MEKPRNGDADEHPNLPPEGWTAPAAHSQAQDTWVARRLKQVAILIVIGLAVALIAYVYSAQR
jgi:hypothetical protein